MAGYSLVPGSFPVLAAKLKQKGREGLGTRLRWVYDPVSVYFYQWLLIMFMCMVKKLCDFVILEVGGGRGDFIYIFFLLLCGHQRQCYLLHVCTLLCTD